jgi:hypothetical protein
VLDLADAERQVIPDDIRALLVILESMQPRLSLRGFPKINVYRDGVCVLRIVNAKGTSRRIVCVELEDVRRRMHKVQ